MADELDLTRPDALDGEAGRGYAEEPPEVEEEDLPRRAASARFIVDSQVGSEALLRDAMDPANQSLAEALRLSFRVLQAVIVVLIVLFLASGFKTVDDGYSGVRTLWGRIVQSLSPGPKFSVYPYPAGEFITFKAENREVNLGEYFEMRTRGRTHETMLEQTEVFTVLNPGIDGFLITRDGDMAHLELSAKYEIDQPIDFVHAVDDSDTHRDADALVKMALERAAIHVVGRMSLPEFTDPGRVAEIKDNIRQRTQATLDEIKSGIRLVDIQGLKPAPPVAIEKAMNAVQEAQVSAGAAVDDATKQANMVLSSIAGDVARDMLDLIDAYQASLDAGDQQKSAELLAAINSKLESPEITGEVTQIIGRAKAYQAQIESTLGNEYRRFASLLPEFRKHPALVIRQQWLEAYRLVINQPDTEIVYVPEYLASINIALSGSADIQNARRDTRFKEAEAESNARNVHGPSVLTGADMSINKPGRQLPKPPAGGAGG